MRVWLDDVRELPLGFDVHVRTAVAAIELLKTGKVTAISLDHDLGLDYHPVPNSGYHVAKWIEEAAFNGELKPLEVFVHSQNRVGAEHMRMALENAKRFWTSTE